MTLIAFRKILVHTPSAPHLCGDLNTKKGHPKRIPFLVSLSIEPLKAPNLSVLDEITFIMFLR